MIYALSTLAALYSSERRSPCESEPVGDAGRCREPQNPSGSWSWGGRSSARYREARNATQGPNFGLIPFRACAENFRRWRRPSSLPTLSRHAATEPRSCGDSRWQRPTPGCEILPWADGMPRCSWRRRTVGYQGALRMSDSDLPSPRVLCSWKAFPQPARADRCVLVPIPQTSREVTSVRNAAVTGLLVMQKHY